MNARILLVRHGRQNDARCNVDVGLAPEGFQQAELVARRLAGHELARVISSDMIRARQTAQAIAEKVGLTVDVIPELRELDFGAMTGLTDDEIADQFAEFKARQEPMDIDLRYPGGESASDIIQRAMPVLTGIAQRSDGAVAIATHGVVIRSVVAHILGAPLARWRLVSPGLENGSITELSWRAAEGRFSIERLNDHSHLDGSPELLRAAWGVSEN